MKLCRLASEQTGGSCRKIAKEICRKTDLVAVKVVRGSLADLGPTLQRMPDHNIIFYSRDPRAMAWSRIRNALTFYFRASSKNILAEEAKILCMRMLEDLITLNRFETKYPGAVIRLCYEVLVQDPLQWADRLFQHAGIDVPERYLEHHLCFFLWRYL